MKKKARLNRTIFAIIGMSLLVNACNLNSPDNSVVLEPTSTPTASNSSIESNPAATSMPEGIPLDPPSVPAVQDIDVCGFFTSVDAEPIVGTALITVSQGSDLDDEEGALNFCNYIGDDVALVLSISQSSAPRDSTEWQEKLLETINLQQPIATPEAASALGEQAYWVVNEDAAGWYVAKFPYIFALAVGGNIGYAEDYKEDIRALAHRVADALP